MFANEIYNPRQLRNPTVVAAVEARTLTAILMTYYVRSKQMTVHKDKTTT